MAKILHFSDSHAQRGAWADRPIFGDSEHALRQIAALAIAQKVEAVIGAGDLADRQVNSSGPPMLLYRFAARLHQAGIPLYFLEGQHDMAEPAWLSQAAGAVHLHKRQVTIAGRKFYGLNWTAKRDLAVALAEIPADTEVFVGHQVWAEWMGEITNPEGSIGEVPHVAAVWTGDLHDYRLARFGPRGVVGLSSGATCKQEIQEPDQHFVVIYDTDIPPGDLQAYRRVRIPGRPILRVGPIETDQQAEATVLELPGLVRQAAVGTAKVAYANIDEPYVHLTYSAEFASLPVRCEEALERAGLVAHLFPKKVGRVKTEEEANRPPAPSTAAEALPQVLDPTTDPDGYELGRRLLEAGPGFQPVLDDWSAWFAKGVT